MSPMPPVRFASLESPIGRLWLTGTDAGLRTIQRGEHPDLEGTPDPDALAGAVTQVEAYFDGRLRAFSIGLDLSGKPPFDVDVWHAAMGIPYGATVSYGELAAAAGSPRAARAVGGAMRRCALFPVVPCHRVIHADGSIRGWGGDLDVKRWLLNLERGMLVGPPGG